MPKAILGRKIGMTRLYDGEGANVPVTVIEAGPCFVSQVKTQETDGYDAIQMAFEDVKARNSTFQVIGHDAKAGLAPKRFHKEVRLDESEVAEYEAGQEINVESFESTVFVDVTGTSKGKGFQGGMKRHGFAGQEASHGVERKHRSPGSIGGRSSNLGTGKPKKGIRMAGHMGAEQVTVRSLKVVGVDKEKNLLLVKGPVPGPKQGLIFIREAKRLYKGKAKLAAAAG
ncbi:50S ribosomal protein L3 [Algisphaera agarilytica]|uniref:Large ribosomal subunit protein uL3 n=1 Tax=Algisphaera agarilytica TaxID=1385975 RepID=A0A7X0LLW0_9BACT|nr:50S ribosomal protein L3 [Algisphaera agarilytica]MBB6431026.1 large subunit ribosomal protein L3 [Algisphaera agarilytica]